MANRFKWALAVLALWAGIIQPTNAQWLTQTNLIVPGWSAVYCYVDASSQPILPAISGVPLAAGNPIDQIWLWKYPVSDAQYSTSPNNPLSGGGQWLTWQLYQTNSANTLSAIIPNSAYLVHSSATTNYTWKVQGHPVAPSYTWDMTGLNFIGFDTPYATPPSFQNYFSPDPAVSAMVQIYQYVGGDFSPVNPQYIFATGSTPVNRGQAYWVSATNVFNAYFGPFKLSLPNPVGLSYGSTVGQLTISLANSTTNNLTVTARLQPSEIPPAGQANIVGVPPLLLRGALNSATLAYAYTSLPVGTANSWTLAPAGQPGSTISFVLGVNRFAMTGSPGALYAGYLQFTDSLGFSEVDVPVSAVTANTAGLWLGSASISQVGSYLKNYATNVDGSYQQAPVTEQHFVTNYPAMFVTTNQVINETVVSNIVVNYSNNTNLVVNYYTTNWNAGGTNYFVLGTNQAVNTYALSNLVITTTTTNFYVTNNTIVWQSVWSTNLTGSAFAVTNFMTVTNIIAKTTNNAPVVVTNLVVNYLAVTNEVTTNAPYSGPVTIQSVSNWTANSTILTTNKAFLVVGTNALSLVTTNGAVQNFAYWVTNLTVSVTATTNFVVTNTAMDVIVNGPLRIVVNPQIYNYSVSTSWETNYLTNTFAISNSFAQLAGGSSLLGSVTNQLFAVVTNGPIVSWSTNYGVTLYVATTNAAYTVTTNAMTGGGYVVTSINTNLGAVVTPYPLRLIIFNDGTNATLLQRVYYGINQNSNIVATTQESLLDPSHLNSARRISCTSLPWTPNNTTWPFVGQLVLGGALSTTVTDNYDDQAANPFLHTYHPDHNNLDLTQNPPRELPEGSQSYGITRSITLSVQPNAADFNSLTTANSSLAGTYFETTTLTGLGGATRTFTSAGNFTLTCISPIATLTTQ
jgi:hypothetical protein